MAVQRDIFIRVYGRSSDTSPYPVDATLDDDSYFPGGELRIPEEELLTLNLDVQPYGTRLGQCLFTAPILRALEKAYATVSAQSAGQMRVRLCIDPGASDLHAYPWERLFVQWQGSSIPLAASSLVPFSRFIPLEQGEQEPIDERPIRILFAVANPISLPAGLDHIDVESQLKSLTDGISGISDITVTVLPGRTALSAEYKEELETRGCRFLPGPATLDRLVAAAGQNHIVHLLSHGSFDGKTASLFLEDEDGDFARALDLDITAAIAALSAKPKLIYLAACDSGKQSASRSLAAAPAANVSRPLVGLAPKLVQAGVPAVIAMQTLVEVETARKLAASFYSKVLEHGEVDRALSEARFEIYGPKSTEWWIPVLFLRLKNGRLFTTDPVREAIQTIQAKFARMEDRFYLPLQAVSLKSKELIRDWERMAAVQKTGADLWQSVQDFRAGLTVITGNAGTGKSMLLRRLVRANADQPWAAGLRILPLLIDLREYQNVRSSGPSRLQKLIYDSFRALSPSLPEPKFERLLAGGNGVLFRFLFDNADAIPDSARGPALLEIEKLADGSPHQCVIAIDCRLFQPSDAIQELLVIQPLSRRQVVRYLSPRDDSPDEKIRGSLLQAIEDAEIFELAAMPWLLLHMLDQVKRALPRSRVMVLEDWVDTALYSAAPDGGRSFRAKPSLYALGWKLHSERRPSLSLEEAFAVLASVRSRREYNLEDLLNQIVASGMLVRVGDEAIRFAYPAVQSYCAACALLDDPRRSALIDDIAATLGQLSRVVWWGRVLALTAGMLPDPIAVLQPLVNGAYLTQGEQVFVAAECLIEHEHSMPSPTPHPGGSIGSPVQSLCRQICAALLWRTKRVNEFRFEYRARSVEWLGLLRRTETIPTLISLALDRVRVEDDGSQQFEYSQVRSAAIRALVRMRDGLTSDLLAAHPHAADLLKAWTRADIGALSALLKDTDEGVQGAAAFALADLQTAGSAAPLYAAFRDSTTSPSTLWAIADALRALEPVEVLKQLVLPCIAEAEAPGSTELPVTPLYERLIFLIGELRTYDPAAGAFVSRYVTEPVAARLKGRAMIALAKLHAVDEAREQRWEAVIHGDFAGIAAVGDPNSLFLRRKGIEAAGEMGDIDLLNRARQTQDWIPELEEAFFRAAEACSTMASGGRP